MLYWLDMAWAWAAALIFFALVCLAGAGLLPTKWKNLPEPYPAALSLLIGWHVVASLTFLAGWLTGVSLVGLFLVVLLPLMVLSAVAVKRKNLSLFCLSISFKEMFASGLSYKGLVSLSFLAIFIMSVIGSAPPTKHDDLHYQLLVGHRALMEGSIVIHPTPYLTTAPHMVYEAILVNLLAFAPPAATSIFSVLIAVAFLLLAADRAYLVSPKRAAILFAILTISFANAVWWVSASASAASALFSALLVLWMIDEQKLRAAGLVSPANSVAICALTASALAGTKLSFIAPAAMAVGLLVLLQGLNVRTIVSYGALSLIIVGTTYGPWVARTWIDTGNPLGFATFFPSRFYDRARLKEDVESMRSNGQTTIREIITSTRAADDHGPAEPLTPLWGLLGWLKQTLALKAVNLCQPFVAFVLGTATLVYLKRLDLLGWIFISAYVIGYLVHHDLRYHSIDIYGLTIAAVVWAPGAWFSARNKKLAPAILCILSAPTVAAMAYYSTVFLPVIVGTVTKEQYLQQQTSMYTVYQWIHSNTPSDARFCVVTGGGLPRLFYLDRFAMGPEGLTKSEAASEVQRSEVVFSRKVSDGRTLVPFMDEHNLTYLLNGGPLVVQDGFVLVQTFKDVLFEGWRTPGTKPVRGDAWLYRREKAKSAPSI